jgi:FSR family fosmidomycin resistance protein-like MFS transporter
MPSSRKTTLLVAILGHFNVDLFASLVPIFLAQLSRSFHLSNTQIGFGVLAYTMTAALSQPGFGYLADHLGGRLVATCGIVWISVWMAVAGFAPNYYALVAALMLAGLGSGAYHPQGAVHAAVSSATKKGSGTSIFFLGGSIGFAVGPLLGSAMFSSLGPSSIGLVSFLGIPVALAIWQSFPVHQPDRSKPLAVSGPTAHWLSQVSILVLAGFVISQGLRAAVMDSYTAYVPKYYLDQGLAPSQYGLLTSLFLAGASLGGLLGGFLADRLNKKFIITTALALSVPVLYGFLHSGPNSRLIFVPLLGLLLSAPFTPALLIAQGFVPNRLPFITGLAMSYLFICGGIGTSLTGVFADRFGLYQVMSVSLVLLIIATLASLLISHHSTEPLRAAPSSSDPSA